ncbi:MAG: hypothetical protein AABX74_00860 [Nanoarchaeota archaeon]
MAEQEVKEVHKKKGKAEGKMTVKSYQQDINVEKQKMGAYSKKFGSTVRSLQADFRKHAKDMKAAAENMREEGIKKMSAKVGKFKGEIQDQIKENKTAVAHIASNIKYFLGEINKKKRDFRSYAKVSFWGVSE